MFTTLISNPNGFCKTTMGHLKTEKSQAACRQTVDLIGDTDENIQSTDTPQTLTTNSSHKKVLTSSGGAATNRFMYVNFSSTEAGGS
jgi:hypothetical protein